MTASKAQSQGSTEQRGAVLDVLRQLLTSGRSDEVIALFTKLVSRNEELERLLGTMRAGRNPGEHLSQAQLDLFLNKLREASDNELADANRQLEEAAREQQGRPERTKPEKQPAVRRRPAANLRRIDNPIPVPAEERPCPNCGAARKCLFHETTPVIELIPAEVIVRNDIREILGCDSCDAELVRAPMGDKVIEGGAYGSHLVADLVVSKYDDGLPLYRKAQILERLGLSMPSSSMSDQITWATDLMRPIWNRLKLNVLEAKVLHTDGTSLPVLDRDGPKGIVTGALWGYVGDQSAAVYLYTSTAKKVGQRPGEVGPQDFLQQRTGPIVADAANLLDVIFQDPARIEVGCNMHSRRYFVKALEAGDERAAVPLAAFQTLYDVEDAARDLDPDGRRALRQQRSRPVYEQLFAWCQTYQPREPPSSLLGKAIQYLINHHLALMRFLDNGILPIDNGIVERLHRRPAITRRNFLFAGSHAAAERAAIAYSVLGTCRLLGVNPIEYLGDILPRLARGVVIARDIATMMPAAWKASRAAAAPATP